MKVADALTVAMRSSAVFNPDVQSAPACILWPDGDRQWEAVIPRLQADLPELFVLGDYQPERRTGPAIWLRCVIAGKVDGVSIPPDLVPILYLPGASRQDLRAVETCPDRLKPMAELQYRGVLWSQVNAKDWTVLAFLKSDQGGLGLDVAQDNPAKKAMQLALYRLLDEEVELLRGKRLDKDDFNTLLSGGDPIRDLLTWLDQGDAFRANREENAWRGFVEVIKSQLAFDLENDGALKGAQMLAEHIGPWQSAWDRYCEAPRRYPNIPALIRKTRMPSDMFADKTAWPQWNEEQEGELRQALLATEQQAPHLARKNLAELEERHAPRRNSVWAELSEAPLAQASEHLATMAEATGHNLAAGAAQDMVGGYRSTGWRADEAVLRALACVHKSEDVAAVEAAIRAVYLPWCDEAARHLQKLVAAEGYPGGDATKRQPLPKRNGECVLFVDGLRFDVAQRLGALLANHGCLVETENAWAALPSVTATAKPAVSPVAKLITGKDVSADFEPSVAATGQSLKGGYHLRKLLVDTGWQVLGRTETGDPTGSAWTEAGDIDHEGHDRGWRLAKQLDGVLAEIRDRVVHLLTAGWTVVHIVTDHGWLLLPGGLPKVELPSALADNTWGRCAAIKPGAATEETLYPWYWNISHCFALPGGVSCYRTGVEYTHGGVSLQECLVQKQTVTLKSRSGRSGNVRIKGATWKGLRCRVTVEGNAGDLTLDVRTHAGNANTSVIVATKSFNNDGICSVIVEDEEMTGHDAVVAILDGDGNLVAQQSTIIGETGA